MTIEEIEYEIKSLKNYCKKLGTIIMQEALEELLEKIKTGKRRMKKSTRLQKRKVE